MSAEDGRSGPDGDVATQLLEEQDHALGAGGAGGRRVERAVALRGGRHDEHPDEQDAEHEGQPAEARA